MPAVRFLLNGEVRTEDGVPPTTTVLDWLRTRAHLTGTKEGCAEGDCGACTIAVARPQGEGGPRWEAVNSCLLMLPQIDGCEVLTVEGLSRPGGPLHPVQQAMIETDATQCGYCTPGFVMAMFAFREGGEPADDDRIHEALAGNLCRCTGYRAIVEACRKVVANNANQDTVAGGEFQTVAASPPSPLWGGSARAARRGGVLSDADDDGRHPHPQPVPTRGRGATTPCVPDEEMPAGSQGTAKQGTAGAECVSSEYVFGGQQFFAPSSLDELLALRAEHPDALLLAGGTDLGLRVSKHREALPRVISTASVRELRFVREDSGALEIGAACTYTQAMPHIDRHFPSFGALIRRIGSRQIRNLGTFAGNLVTASPIGDTLPTLIALGAQVTLRSAEGARTLPVEDFITGYRTTALPPDGIVEAIRIPFVPAGEHFATYKLSKRFDQDISTVVAAFRLALDDGKVASLRAVFGGMAARTARAAAVERALTGRPWTQDALGDVDALIVQDFSPLSDFRGSAAYRLRASAGLLRRFQMETALAPPPIRLEAL